MPSLERALRYRCRHRWQGGRRLTGRRSHRRRLCRRCVVIVVCGFLLLSCGCVLRLIYRACSRHRIERDVFQAIKVFFGGGRDFGGCLLMPMQSNLRKVGRGRQEMYIHRWACTRGHACDVSMCRVVVGYWGEGRRSVVLRGRSLQVG